MQASPTLLASEDVIINAPLSYAGSAQRLMRLRRLAPQPPAVFVVTVLAVVLIVLAWAFVTSWYLLWGLWLVPYRILRRGARKRKAEALRHRELLSALSVQGAGGSLAVTVPATPIGVEAASADELRASPPVAAHLPIGSAHVA